MIANERRREAIAALQPYIERARRFSGWSFHEMRQTPLGPPPSWDYEALARERLSGAPSVLDMGTGGGEVYSRILGGFAPARAVAIEYWHVNAPIARDRLSPLRASVARANSLRLPFRDAAFDLVLNRHEELDPLEVDRVLRPGGRVLTQQVDRSNLEELRAFFPRKTVWPDHFVDYQQAWRAIGYDVSSQQHSRLVAYETLGDIVFQIIVAPWEIPDFDPIAEIDPLLALEDAHGGAHGIAMTESRYLIEVRKPA